MKNLAIILLGSALVASCVLTGSDALPLFEHMPEHAADVAQPETDQKDAIQQLAAVLAKNLVSMASYVPNQELCYYSIDRFYEYDCGHSLHLSFKKYPHLLTPLCQSIHADVVRNCPTTA